MSRGKGNFRKISNYCVIAVCETSQRHSPTSHFSPWSNKYIHRFLCLLVCDLLVFQDIQSCQRFMVFFTNKENAAASSTRLSIRERVIHEYRDLCVKTRDYRAISETTSPLNILCVQKSVNVNRKNIYWHG